MASTIKENRSEKGDPAQRRCVAPLTARVADYLPLAGHSGG